MRALELETNIAKIDYMKTMIIDDDVCITNFMESALGSGHRGLGMDVKVFNNELQIFQQCDLEDYSLIIIDINLVETNGYNLAKALRIFTQFDTPFIFISSDKNKVYDLYKSDIRNSYFLPKPFKQQELQDVVKQMLSA